MIVREGKNRWVSSPSTALLRGIIMFTFCIYFFKVVTPWEVEAADEIDYSKLVRSFGYAAALHKHRSFEFRNNTSHPDV